MEKDNVVKQSTMENYLNGSTTPDIQAAAKLADYFGVSLDWLITGVNTEDKIFHDDPKDDVLRLLKKQQAILEKHDKILERLVSIIEEPIVRDEIGTADPDSRA